MVAAAQVDPIDPLFAAGLVVDALVDPSFKDSLLQMGGSEEAATTVLLSEGAQLGRWTIAGVLGKGRQGAAVYLATLGEEGAAGRRRPEEEEEHAAVKFPVHEDEAECFALAQRVKGVPELVDSGESPFGSFIVMPVLWAGLDEVLRRLDHDGFGGRMSWEAARSLGCMLIRTLQGIHAKGVLHCDIKPGNIMLQQGTGPLPYLVDFGRARKVGSARLDGVIGALEHNSIRAGIGDGEHLPADDLECIGWLMLFCVLGHLPWRNQILDFKRADVPRDTFGRHISHEKEQYLSRGCECSSWRYHHCPEELRDFFRCVRHHGGGGKPDYARLISILSGNGESWERLVTDLVRKQASFSALAVAAVRGRLVWRSFEGGLECEEEAAVPKDLHVRVTGRDFSLGGGTWLEVERVWAPGLPPALLEKSCWVATADEGGAPLLEPVDLLATPAKPREPSDEAEFFLLGSWDGWREFVALESVAVGGATCCVTVALSSTSSFEEFQVVQDCSWERRFYPGDDGEICGPSNEPGSAWQVWVPSGSRRLHVVWDPCGMRSLEWSFS